MNFPLPDVRSLAAALVTAAAIAAPAAAQDEGAWSHEITYTADVAGPLSGAGTRAGRYLDNLDVIVDGDLEKAIGWRGGKVHLYLLNNSGGAPNDLVGALQGVDNIEVGRPRSRVYELWFEQSFAGDTVGVLAGLYDLNSEFYSTEASDLLINPSFGIGSEFASTGPNGPSIFPSTALAVRVRAGAEEGAYVRAAALNAYAGTVGDPDGPKFEFENGALLIAEAGWQGPVRLAAGAWTYTDRQEDIREVDAAGDPRRSRAAGAYVLAEGELWSDGADRSAAAFLRAGTADGDTTPFKGGWQAGVKLTGAFASRPQSAFSVGVQQGFLSEKFRRNGADQGVDLAHAESGLELTYSDTVGRVTIQPDLQFIRHPGGERGRDTAVVGAVRFTVSLG